MASRRRRREIAEDGKDEAMSEMSERSLSERKAAKNRPAVKERRLLLEENQLQHNKQGHEHAVAERATAE